MEKFHAEREREIMVYRLYGKLLDLNRSEVIRRFDAFDAGEWRTVGSPRWTIEPDAITGGPEKATHGQIFYREALTGDVVMAFTARLIAPSGHDLVWWYRTALDGRPWGKGYLGALGGWFRNRVGIETVPDFTLSGTAAAFPVQSEVDYRIVAGCLGNHHFIAVDGTVIFELFIPEALPEQHAGYCGFGIYQSHARYSRLRLYRPYWTEAAERYL